MCLTYNNFRSPNCPLYNGSDTKKAARGRPFLALPFATIRYSGHVDDVAVAGLNDFVLSACCWACATIFASAPSIVRDVAVTLCAKLAADISERAATAAIDMALMVIMVLILGLYG